MIQKKEYGIRHRLRESYRVTGDFDHVAEKGYRRHCGPTAITNFLLTIQEKDAASPEDVFARVVRSGRRFAYYMNMDLGVLGGTFDIRAGGYIRRCLKEAGFMHFRVKPRRLLTEKAARAALSRGSILYLELRHHRKYGSHHVLCYGGVETVYEPDGKEQKSLEAGESEKASKGSCKLKRELKLRIADGWNRTPQFFTVRELGFAYMIELEETSDK